MDPLKLTFRHQITLSLFELPLETILAEECHGVGLQ
jgi:hypothetical protein